MSKALIAFILAFTATVICTRAMADQVPKDFAISEGKVGGVLQIRKFGENPGITAASGFEDVWDGGGLYPWQTSAQSIEVVSAGAQDNASGTGARSIRVYCLDANGAIQSEDVVPNNTTPVALTMTCLHVYRAYVLTAGSDATNNAAITIRIASAGATLAVIQAGMGQTLMTPYQVPSGYTGYLDRLTVGLSKETGPTAAVVQLMNRPAGGAWRVLATYYLSTTSTSLKTFYFDYPIVIEEGGQIRVRADSSANNTGVYAEFDLVMYQN